MDQQAIAERKQKSKEIYMDQQRKQYQLKAGRAYFRDNKMEMFTATFEDVKVSSALVPMPPEAQVELIVWCVCSPKDKYSERVARGLLGYRCLNKNNDERFIHESKIKSKSDIQRIRRWFSWLINEAFQENCSLPPRLQKAIMKETVHE